MPRKIKAESREVNGVIIRYLYDSPLSRNKLPIKVSSRNVDQVIHDRRTNNVTVTTGPYQLTISRRTLRSWLAK